MNGHPPRRRRVEIYFVLYLVALVLLMPDSGERPAANGVQTAIADARLDLAPDRLKLVCKLQRDSVLAVRINYLDSVNTIRYSGAVTDVKISARIEDQTSGQVITILPNETATPLFSLEHQPTRNAVVFRWHPDVSDGVARTFRVTIMGDGSPLATHSANSTDSDVLPAGLRITGSTQFVLATIAESEAPPPVVTIVGGRDTVIIRDTTTVGGGQLGEFWIDAARDRITTIAGREWTNRISIGGADPARDLVALPAVRVVGEQVGEIQRFFDQRTLVVRGKAPRNGTIAIEVSARRRDGQQRTASFLVAGMPLSSVDLPDVVYPNIDYVVDPRLPGVENSRASIRDGDRVLATVTEGTLRLRVTPRDTGRVLTFERFIDGVGEGTPRTITVRGFGAPVIRDVKRDADPKKRTVVVQFYSSDRTVNRPTLRVLDGNALEPRKLSGFLRAADNMKPTISWLEVFEVTQRDPNRPFTFRVQATDEQGRSSSVWIED